MTSPDVERQKERDPELLQELRARLAQIKMATAIRQLDALFSPSPNLIEQALLDRPAPPRKEEQ